LNEDGDWGIYPPPFTQKFFNLLGFLRKKSENPPPPKIFPYKKSENPPPLKFFHTKNFKIPLSKNFWLRRCSELM